MATRRTEIGQFIFEHDSGELRTSGGVSRLSPKAAAVLSELINADGKVVNREALHDSVWANQYVTDAQVSKAITELRQAFGDTASDSRYIETLPKRGYRLLATTSELTAEEDDRRPKWRAGPKLSIALVAVCLIAVIFALTSSEHVIDLFSTDASTDSQAASVTVLEFTGVNAGADEWAIAVQDDVRTALSSSALKLVAQDANTRYALSGTVRIVQSDAVITIELLDQHSGTTLWRKQMAQARDDGILFEKAPFVSSMVQLAISMETAREQFADSPQAANAFIESILEYNEWALGGGGNFRVAESHAKKALEHDPHFAPAHRILAIWYALRLGNELTAAEALPLAHNHVQLWLQAEPDDTFPLALINRLLDLDYQSALLNIAHAETHPTPVVPPAMISTQRCQIRLQTGELAKAESACLEALAYGPSAEIFHQLARISRKRGQNETALNYLHEATQHEATNSIGSLEGTIVAARLEGDTAKTEQALDQLLSTRGVQPERYMQFIAMAGRTELATELAEAAEVSYAEGNLKTFAPLFFTYNQLGNTDKALFWLKKAIENREHSVIIEIRSARGFESLCEDPRAQPIFARLRELEASGSPTPSAATLNAPSVPEVQAEVCGEA